VDLQSGAFVALTLGFLLGLRHATDADHVVAVSTIVSEYRNAWRGIWVGASWGLGHTTPLLILGVVILLLKEVVLDRYEAVAPLLEFGVGIMLVFLGVQVFWNLRRRRLHTHAHTDDEGSPHVHIHASHPETVETDTAREHGLFQPGRPFFRMKSYLVGIVHGLAGSAAVMLLLLPQVSTFTLGVLFILIFGLGTVLSMAGITLILGIPFAITGQFERLNAVVARIAGTASVLLGVALMSDIGLGTSLLPF
jgi:ABC-type nickel/cobalt efflux system permease component RcnA